MQRKQITVKKKHYFYYIYDIVHKIYLLFLRPRILKFPMSISYRIV
jgi:hypothetical protein